MGVRESGSCSLFETKETRGCRGYRYLAGTILMGICLIWIYRATHIPKTGEEGRWAWIGLFAAELWFGIFWVITQSVRWNHVFHHTYKDRLQERYGDGKLPRVDIFVFTADPTIEPATIVINTVLSVMAYDYPSDKLSVYLSDDGASVLTFYALFEASRFAKYWIPFCKKFNIKPTSPAAYFAGISDSLNSSSDVQRLSIKRLYEEMVDHINAAIELGRIPHDIKEQHKGFSEWNSSVTKQDHHTILQILINGKDLNEVDIEGNSMPTLVYLAREKRARCPHNFKAGAVNALMRLSSKLSNAPIILLVDCDMYSNDSNAVRDALCFFMDEEKGHDIAFVQFPQKFNNISKNDLYGNLSKVIVKVEHSGIDAQGGSIYSGTGSFHRRESLCGKIYTTNWKEECYKDADHQGKLEVISNNVTELEERAKVLADCSYEENTQWGQEMGLKYGCPVEDVITGLAIQCRGWRSVYFLPERSAFLGIAPITLEHALIQYKRWSEGLFQIFFSKYCPFIYGRGKIKLGLQMGYCVYCLWAPNSIPTLYYLVVPSICFMVGIPLFPKISSLWFLPFAYVFVAKNAYSLVEAMQSGDSLRSWWNLQRMWMMRRTTSYLFSFIDVIIKQCGLSQTTFTVTAKVVDDDVSKRYEQEIMEFGGSPLFIIIGSLALCNLLALFLGLIKQGGFMEMDIRSTIVSFALQIILCGLIVAVNVPVYDAMFFRNDKGRMSIFVTFGSIVLALVPFLLSML